MLEAKYTYSQGKLIKTEEFFNYEIEQIKETEYSQSGEKKREIWKNREGDLLYEHLAEITGRKASEKIYESGELMEERAIYFDEKGRKIKEVEAENFITHYECQNDSLAKIEIYEDG